MDIQAIGNAASDGGYDKTHRLLTQDVTYYLIGTTANTAANDSFKNIIHKQKEPQQKELQENNTPKLYQRAISILDTIKKRVWKDKWPLITERELRETGPWPLKSYQYHNQTFWPWTTGVEMLARSRFNQV